MRSFLLLAAVLIQSAVGETTAERALFNGSDLTGWDSFLKEGKKTADVWSVRDGVLVCKGEPMGYLHTKEEFTNFKLTVEWRWAPGTTPGNSGVLMRLNGEARPLPRSLEVQLKSGNAGDVFGFHGMTLSGEAARMKHVENHELGGKLTGVAREGGAEVAPGEWNKLEITLKQGELDVVLNGKPVNRATGCEVISGPIALQSEGGEIHFRTVRITPL
jgi:Domain of Unknown Function (DUF1080)